MKIVKLTYPETWNFYKKSLPALVGHQNNEVCFEINNSCTKCDVWIVWGNLSYQEQVTVSSGITIFIAEEAYPEKLYPHQFLQQFSHVYATRNDIVHPQFKRTHYTGSWFIHKSFSDLKEANLQYKNKDLSVISSNLTLLEGHKKRFAFVNRLIGHFKDKLDVYGRGYHEIPDKLTGLSSYKYSIAIENSVIPDYFTEKIWDCYLSNTLPFYYGCPNIEQYFPADAFIKIDIEDYKKSIDIIEAAIATDAYTKALPSLLIARDKVLHEYAIMPYIYKLIKSAVAEETRQLKVKLKSIEQFEQPKPRWKKILS